MKIFKLIIVSILPFGCASSINFGTQKGQGLYFKKGTKEILITFAGRKRIRKNKLIG